jgi:hypothetical protein
MIYLIYRNQVSQLNLGYSFDKIFLLITLLTLLTLQVLSHDIDPLYLHYF